MGASTPKQFIPLNGKPLFLYSVDAFFNAYEDVEVIIVLPKSHLTEGNQILSQFGYAGKKIKLVEGGNTRFESVKNGLNEVLAEGIVFIHDAVRCLVSPDLIKRCSEAASAFHSAIPVIAVKDSMRRVAQDGTSQVVDRNQLRIVQTPQTFQTELIKNAFQTEYREAFTDEASVLESSGINVNLVEGEESNIKITYKSDLDFATWKLNK